MTSLQINDKGLDYAYQNGQRTPGVIAGSGFKFVGRYIDTGTNPKLMRKAEYEALKAAGLEVFAIHERTQTAWRGGYGIGQQHALAANQAADVLGYPMTHPIIYCVDTGVYSNSDLALVDKYLDGLWSVPGRPVGLYAGALVLDPLHAKIAVGWQAAAGSWSNYKQSAYAYFRQLIPQWMGADQNIVIRVPTFLSSSNKAGTVYSPPLQLEPIVFSVKDQSTGGVYLLAGSGAIYALEGAQVHHLGNDPQKEIGPNGQPYFSGRTAASLEVAVDGSRYTVIATSGERYSYP